MKKSIQLGALSVINIGISFLFQWYIVIKVGPGTDTDALFAGMTLPQMIITIVSGSLMGVMVPLLAGEDKQRQKNDAWSFFIIVACLFGLLSGILYLTAWLWIPLTVPGFDHAAKELTIKIAQIQLIGMFFTAINGVQWATSYSQEKFILSEIAPIISGLISAVILVWLLPIYGVIGAAWSTVLRVVIQSLLLMPAMGRPHLDKIFNSTVQTAFYRMKPILIGSVYYKTDPFIERYLLSYSNNGDLSLYYLAQQIYSSLNQIISKAISSPLVPRLSSLYKLNNFKEFQRITFEKSKQITYISIAMLVILLVPGFEFFMFVITYLNLKFNNFDQLRWILLCLSGVFLFGAVGQIFSSSLYSIGDTHSVAKISVITYSVYVPIKIVSFYTFGITGLAVSTSILYVSDSLIMAYVIQKKIRKAY